MFNSFPDDYIAINAKWVEWDHDNECWCFMNEDAFEKAQSLKEHDKELCQKIIEMLTDRAELVDFGGCAEFMFTTYDLQESIKEILGVEKLS